MNDKWKEGMRVSAFALSLINGEVHIRLTLDPPGAESMVNEPSSVTLAELLRSLPSVQEQTTR